MPSGVNARGSGKRALIIFLILCFKNIFIWKYFEACRKATRIVYMELSSLYLDSCVNIYPSLSFAYPLCVCLCIHNFFLNLLRIRYIYIHTHRRVKPLFTPKQYILFHSNDTIFNFSKHHIDTEIYPTSAHAPVLSVDPLMSFVAICFISWMTAWLKSEMKGSLLRSGISAPTDVALDVPAEEGDWLVWWTEMRRSGSCLLAQVPQMGPAGPPLGRISPLCELNESCATFSSNVRKVIMKTDWGRPRP